jgi:hypothetical protein
LVTLNSELSAKEDKERKKKGEKSDPVNLHGETVMGKQKMER